MELQANVFTLSCVKKQETPTSPNMQTHTGKFSFRCWSMHTDQKDKGWGCDVSASSQHGACRIGSRACSIFWYKVSEFCLFSQIFLFQLSGFITQLLNHISCFQISDW